MATFRLPILGPGTKPDNSGDVFFEPYSIKATNDVWDRLVAVFNDSGTRIGIAGGFQVPQNYVGTANLIVEWTSTATTGDIEWDFDYRSVAAGESFDQSGTQESVNSNDAAPASVNLRQSLSISLTDSNFAVGDEVEFEHFRDGTDGGDGMSAAGLLFGLYFEYADA